MARGEGQLAKHGPLVVETGKHTGRSAKDKFIVRDAETERQRLVGQGQQADDARALRRAQGRFPRRARPSKDKLYVAGPVRRLAARAPRQRARHQRVRLAQPVHPHAAGAARPRPSSPASSPNSRSSTCRASAPTRRATARRSETVIAVNFTEKLILIGGTAYAGEMKKCVFGLLNYLLPAAGRHADALLGQYRPRRQDRGVLRPFGHRQDDAFAPTPAAR